jgi:hypothetical protein
MDRGDSRSGQPFARLFGQRAVSAECGEQALHDIVRFENERDVQTWLNSPKRKRFIEKAQDILEDGDKTQIRAGIDVWFTPDDAPAKPPAHKQFLLTLAGIYPLTLIVPSFYRRCLKPCRFWKIQFCLQIHSRGGYRWDDDLFVYAVCDALAARLAFRRAAQKEVKKAEMVNRRDFVKGGIVAGIAASLGGAIRGETMSVENEKTVADLILINGKIATQDQRRDVRRFGGDQRRQILAAGKEKTCCVLRATGLEVVNLNKRTVIPGFAGLAHASDSRRTQLQPGAALGRR